MHIRRMKLKKLKINSTNIVTYEGKADESEDEYGSTYQEGTAVHA